MSRKRGRSRKAGWEAAVPRVAGGEKVEVVAHDYGVSPMTVHRWMREAGYFPRRVSQWFKEPY